jgi:hypothetical protein
LDTKLSIAINSPSISFIPIPPVWVILFIFLFRKFYLIATSYLY